MSTTSQHCSTTINTADLFSVNDCHLGRNILNTLKKYSDDINQIELTTANKESHGSVRLRTIRMAQAMKAKGLKKGDLIIISAVNHNDACIPFIASFYLGIIPLPLTIEVKPSDMPIVLQRAKPSYVFADPETAPIIQKALKEIGHSSEIAIFGETAIEGFAHFSEFVQQTNTEESFECENFDPKITPALVICTKLQTGFPKLVTLSHFAMYYNIQMTDRVATEEQRLLTKNLNFFSLFRISTMSSVLSSCIMGTTRIHSMKPFSPADFVVASQVYTPSSITLNQYMLFHIINYAENNDFTLPSFQCVHYSGNPFFDVIMTRFENLFPNAKLFGMLCCVEALKISIGQCYKNKLRNSPNQYIKYKIVDIITGRELGPNEPGELRIKSDCTFLGYYNDPETTSKEFDDDGWYKTGEIIMYDEDGYFSNIDKIKQPIRYKNLEIHPFEIENLITEMPGVVAALVFGKPDPEDGEHPVAIVQLEPDVDIKEYQVMNYVRDNLGEEKQLRGGVLFIQSLPLTYSANDKQLFQSYIDNNNFDE